MTSMTNIIDWLLVRQPVTVRTYHKIVTYIFLAVILLSLINIGMQHYYGFDPRSFKYNVSLISTLAILLWFFLVRSHFKEVQETIPAFTKDEVRVIRRYKEFTWALSEDQKKIFAEGYLAFLKDHNTQNPYPVDTTEYNAWRTGNTKEIRFEKKFN
ncbi:TPA: hypothetical protein ACJEU7_002443 [Acinetobacter baumannii]|uniref:hypothetical protein n=1 Tax=Acinetobacter baumannii TaxID=470 RepID=UPI00224D678D|nr:hypothetical protein [Acinetobacter baumannii]MCX3034254.1 hypothetical protein [Acinetobacter baumannii]